MISHIVSTFSGKPIFGQNGPLYILYILYITQQTICRKLTYSMLQSTKYISSLRDSNLVKIFVAVNNPQITKARVLVRLYKSFHLKVRLSMQVGISEAIRLLLANTNYSRRFSHLRSSSNFDKDLAFREWLAGLIDGAGSFQLTKKGYASLEIVMDLRDKNCLYQVKDKFGGAVKLRAGDNHLRYRLHHREGVLKIIGAINGLIRNPVRIYQFNKIADKYGIPLIQPNPLTYNNGWLSGFLDSNGSIYLNLDHTSESQILVSVTHKNKLLLDPLTQLYGGSIYVLKSAEAFKWTISTKVEITNLLDYFLIYPPRSQKHARIKLIPRYFKLYFLKAFIASEESVLGKAWKHFLTKWNNYEL